MALYAAQSDLTKKDVGEIPDHLKDSHYSGAKKRGHGIGYKYPHDYGGWVNQQYLPDELLGSIYYEPSDNGGEASFKKYLDLLKEKKDE